MEGYNTDGERIKYMIKQVFRMIVRVKPMLVVVFFVIAFLIAGLVMMLVSLFNFFLQFAPILLLLIFYDCFHCGSVEKYCLKDKQVCLHLRLILFEFDKHGIVYFCTLKL